MTQHRFKPFNTGHSALVCEWCHCTEREAAFALGMECPNAPEGSTAKIVAALTPSPEGPAA